MIVSYEVKETGLCGSFMTDECTTAVMLLRFSEKVNLRFVVNHRVRKSRNVVEYHGTILENVEPHIMRGCGGYGIITVTHDSGELFNGSKSGVSIGTAKAWGGYLKHCTPYIDG